ncbi:putative agnoprotein [Myotis polyomavirus VM-2008]|uniref:Putative agnoprotein n=1 Tax=Myotis polyomavirus VM-2008 TaxID=563775 RepID=B6DZZ8_9POLY|nr:putative agnoprotein [Myotis polyomavirus VM-2008]ACI16485.1 putative agnoprotein [Myotis polyomavirus VM-2008]
MRGRSSWYRRWKDLLKIFVNLNKRSGAPPR